MKERPILFSAPMVRAILEGRKTMTRRVATKIKAPKVWTMPKGIDSFWNVNPCWRETPGELCPYGQPGDRLWVRETWTNESGYTKDVCYRASALPFIADGIKWKPSIFMPRAFSRITLEITNVRVERLNDISEEYAKGEGADGLKYSGQGFEHCIYREAFRTLWDSINGPGSWDANPLVWVVEFKRSDNG